MLFIEKQYLTSNLLSIILTWENSYYLFVDLANICGLIGGTGLVLFSGLGIVDGFGDGIGLRSDFNSDDGEDSPFDDIGLDISDTDDLFFDFISVIFILI